MQKYNSLRLYNVPKHILLYPIAKIQPPFLLRKQPKKISHRRRIKSRQAVHLLYFPPSYSSISDVVFIISVAVYTIADAVYTIGIAD